MNPTVPTFVSVLIDHHDRNRFTDNWRRTHGSFHRVRGGVIEDEMSPDRLTSATRRTIGRNLSQKTYLRHPRISCSDGGRIGGQPHGANKPFNPGFTLGESAVTIEKMEDDSFIVTTDKGTQHKAPSVAIAGGLGVFTPRKPPIENLPAFEDKGVDYIVRDPEKFRDKRVVISGGGDSALDWTVFLADVASEVSLVHRRTSFRGHLDTVEKVQELAQQGKVKLITNSEVVDVHGTDQLSQVTIKQKGAEDLLMDCDHWLPLFGLTPTLGPIGNWGLEIEKNAIVVDNATDYRTNIEGIYAIGDVNTYPGKLKLILCGFHEATIMVQSAFKRAFPDKKLSFKYTTVMGGVGSLE